GETGLGGFVVSGVEHILYGLDHILFLLSLLLMAVVVRTGGGEGVAVRPVRQAMAYTGWIVTSFTVAHSVTLIGAALGWFELPGRLVESLIAASIVFVAVDNAVRLDPPRRTLVTFTFGLVHGLGFASMLRPLLPPSEVVLPLLAFNVGVELGQLGLVVVAMPILYAAVRALGPARYRRVVLPLGAVVLGGLGLIWLVERAFEITVLGL
ncbi:MAG TPA: HupE/UreJ family protein, partial [Kofleriaceae bacterium]|nr:HupE/UreJ family protein [Kofleriaceae bacterium]